MKIKFVKNLFVVILFYIIGCSQPSDQNVKKELYPNGRIKSEISILEGKENGIRTTYYENGVIKSKISMKDDLKEGYSYYFYPNGILKAVCFYKKDSADGNFVSFDENRNLSYSTKYSNGKVSYYAKFDISGNIIGGTPFLLIETQKDTIKLGESFIAEIKLNYMPSEWTSSISARIDSTKKDGELFAKIGDSKCAEYIVTPKESGEYKFHIWSPHYIKNEKDSIIKHFETFYTGKYWVEK